MKPPSKYIIVGLGELLWDVFPQGKQLGGAPANFAYMTALLGDRGIVASRLGEDRLGQEAMWQLRSSGLETSQIQSDARHGTGTVIVRVDEKGQPEYRITEDVAWDHLEWTPAWKALAQSADAVCFGSLAQRSQESRGTIREFLRATRAGAIKVFDVNLRQNFYTSELLRESAREADIVKLNEEELEKFVKAFGWRHESEVGAARMLGEEFGIDVICVTRGAKGSLLVTPEGENEHPGYTVKVADTVGAGDAFTAALVYHTLCGAPLKVMNEAANRMGAWVASQEGAMPTADETVLKEVRGAGA